MVNWLDLLFNTIWIFGAALALTAASLAYSRGQVSGIKIRNILKKPGYVLVLSISGALFALGMGLRSKWWWEIGLWVLLIGMFTFIARKSGKKNEL